MNRTTAVLLYPYRVIIEQNYLCHETEVDFTIFVWESLLFSLICLSSSTIAAGVMPGILLAAAIWNTEIYMIRVYREATKFK